MPDEHATKTLPLVPLIASGAAVLLGCLLVGAVLVGFLFFGGISSRPSTPAPPPTLAPAGQPRFPTATPVPTDPPSPTATVTPEEQPTGEPEEATVEPTATSPPAPTNPPAPTSPPQPTPTSPPPTQATQELSNVTFSVSNPVVAANEGIQFTFTLTNASPTEQLPLGLVGVVVFDSNGNNVHFHTSWTGWVMEPGQTVSWTDNVAIGTPGTYQLQLSICFSDVDTCQAGGGDWRLMAQPVTVTVN